MATVRANMLPPSRTLPDFGAKLRYMQKKLYLGRLADAVSAYVYLFVKVNLPVPDIVSERVQCRLITVSLMTMRSGGTSQLGAQFLQIELNRTTFVVTDRMPCLAHFITCADTRLVGRARS